MHSLQMVSGFFLGGNGGRLRGPGGQSLGAACVSDQQGGGVSRSQFA